MMKPHESWAARWQGICARALPLALIYCQLVESAHVHSPLRVPTASWTPGCYALRVKGTLSNQHVVTLESNGITYRSLDDPQ